MTDQTYPPTPEFAANAHIDAAKYEEMYAASVNDPEGFWREHGTASTGCSPSAASRM